MQLNRSSGVTLATFAAALALTAVAYACNVPVFRFALERWRPDAYRVTLLHRGPLTDAQREILRPLAQVQDQDSANVVLRTLDVVELEKPADGSQRVLAALPEQLLSRLKDGDPWLIIQYPEHLRIDIPVWEGPLSRDSITGLADSSVRRELVRRLVDGQTAVWLLLESGQTDKDDAVAKLLESQLSELHQSLKLPELTTDPADELLASTPLKLAFSVLRVPHGSAQEQALAGMLVRCEPDLADRSDPIVFPVFGRGRALLPLIGAGITDKNIQDAAAFLVGPCSCQVKELNPGFDLLLAADWDSLLSTNGQQLTAFQTGGLRLPTTREAELVPIPSGSRPTEVVSHDSLAAVPPASAGSWLLTGGILAGMVAFVVLLVALNSGTRAY